jgi:ribosome-associated translation inhibitor RaiA
MNNNSMKMTIQHFGIRSTDQLDSWMEAQIFLLEPDLQIDEANIRVARQQDKSPAYRAHIHLVTPGPDVLAESHDHTLRAAFLKAISGLRGRITHRHAKRRGRRQQGALKTGALSPISTGGPSR